MIVQATNTGYDLSSNHFDIAIPGVHMLIERLFAAGGLQPLMVVLAQCLGRNPGAVGLTGGGQGIFSGCTKQYGGNLAIWGQQ
jgi:hypothetical protein